MIEQLVAIECAVTFEERDHFAIVAGVVAFLSRNQRREGIRVDAPVPECVLVERQRQAIVLASPRQDLGSHPVVVVPKLAGQHLVRFLPALEVGAGEQLLDARDH